MAFIPSDAKWYIADMIFELTIEHDTRNAVHTNTILIRANSPEEAFEKASELGESQEDTYTNSDGNRVIGKYRGLRDLNVIHDELEHGAELIFEEDIAVSEETIQSWLTPKEQLGIFAPIKSSRNKPNYIAETIVQEMEKYGFSREELRSTNG